MIILYHSCCNKQGICWFLTPLGSQNIILSTWKRDLNKRYSSARFTIHWLLFHILDDGQDWSIACGLLGCCLHPAYFMRFIPVKTAWHYIMEITQHAKLDMLWLCYLKWDPWFSDQFYEIICLTCSSEENFKQFISCRSKWEPMLFIHSYFIILLLAAPGKF